MDIVVLSISILTSYFAHKIHLWLCVLIDIQPRTISTHHYAWSDSCSCILSGTVMIRQVCAAFGTSKVSQQSAAGFCDFMFQYWIHTPGNSSHRITGTFVISSIFNLIWGTFAHGDFLPLAQGHTFPLGSSFSGDFIPDSPSQNCLSAVVLNTRMGKQVTWLGTTASSTTPADNVFLQLLAFFSYFHRIFMHSTFVRSVRLTSRIQRKVCHHLRLSIAIRRARQNRVSPPPEGRFDNNLHLHGAILRFTSRRDLLCLTWWWWWCL